jgi:hypothetical protein
MKVNGRKKRQIRMKEMEEGMNRGKEKEGEMTKE